MRCVGHLLDEGVQNVGPLTLSCVRAVVSEHCALSLVDCAVVSFVSRFVSLVSLI